MSRQSNSIRDIIDMAFPKGFSSNVKFKNKKQKDHFTSINEHDISIITGPAGTGKSFVTLFAALKELKNNQSIEKITILRPGVPVDEDWGFLKGTLEDKMYPYLLPTINIFIELLQEKKNFDALKYEGIIEFLAIAFVRGHTFKNQIVILEEAQNSTPEQMKALISRLGPNSKLILTGDIKQSDRYKDNSKNGLYDALERLKNIDEIGFVEYTYDEIVRHPLLMKIMELYEEVA